jgi:flagellar biosynthesis GTPase FlhF
MVFSFDDSFIRFIQATARSDATSGMRTTTTAETAAAEGKERQRKAAEEEAKKVAAEKAAAEEKERQRKAAEEGAKRIAAEKAAAEEKERQREAVAEEGAKKVAAEKIQSEQSTFFGFAPKPLATGKLTHVFLTHNWSDDEDGRNNHDRVSRINKALQRRGFITWFDEEKMDGQIRQKMTEGIKQTHCVVVCITKVYQDKINSGNQADNCYFEFDYASRKLSNHRIPVVMEKCMLSHSAWDDRLDSELGGTLFVDMSKDDETIFERKCDELATRLNNLIVA